MKFNPYRSWLKLAIDGRAPNHYELLGVPAFEQDIQRIQQAYRVRYAHVRRYEVGDHGEQATRLLEELSRGLVELTDTARKAAYDDRLRREAAADSASASSNTTLPAVEDFAADDPRGGNPLPDADLLPHLAFGATGELGAGPQDVAHGDVDGGLSRPALWVAAAASGVTLLLIAASVATWLLGRDGPPPQVAAAPASPVSEETDEGSPPGNNVTGALRETQIASENSGQSPAASPQSNDLLQEPGGRSSSDTILSSPASTSTSSPGAGEARATFFEPAATSGSGENPAGDSSNGSALGDSAGEFVPGADRESNDAAENTGEQLMSGGATTPVTDEGGEFLDVPGADDPPERFPGLPEAAGGTPERTGDEDGQDSSSLASDSAQRTWQNRDASYRVQAEYLGYQQGLVLLKRLDDGRRLEVEMEQLCESDCQWVRQREGRRLDGVLREALVSIDAGHLARARQLLKTDTLLEDIRADFLAGLLEAIEGREPLDARKHFTVCVRRQPEHMASLNNLACAEIRTGKTTDAVKHWRKALEIEPGQPQVKHNLALVATLVAKGRLQLGRTMLEQVAELTSPASRRVPGGWQYLDYSPPPDVQVTYQVVAVWQGRSTSDTTCMQCSGQQILDCVVPQCKRGKVYVNQRRVVVGGPGGTISNNRKVPVACSGCRGRGKVSCPFCSAGRDRDL